MLTLHRAALLLTPAGPVPDGAVLVEGDRVAALGPYAPVAGARERAWDGLLAPGLHNLHAGWLLETAYHPDPRESLGSAPLLLLDVDPARRGESARRGLQRMLGYGTTAVAGPFTTPSVRTAVSRSGLVCLPAATGGAGSPGTAAAVDAAAAGAASAAAPDLATAMDPLATATLAEAVHQPLAVGGRADFAVFAAASVEQLEHSGAGCCVATVLGGRLLYRRR